MSDTNPASIRELVDWRDRGRGVASDTLLTIPEIRALTAWRERWGEIASTREPGEGRVLRRFWPVEVPLIELCGRSTYGRMVFMRQLYGERKVQS